MRSTYSSLSALLILQIGLSTAPLEAEGSSWPGFRGPAARGTVDGEPLPETWSVASGHNLRWKVPIPGLSHASPVIWDDRVFIATAVSGTKDSLKVGLYGDITPVEDDASYRFELHAFNKQTGKLLWKRVAHEGVPRIKRHTKATHVNSTPATDGKRVVVFFGSEGLFAFDFEGDLLWKKDFGVLDAGFYVAPSAQWGFGSSPIIHDGKVIVQVDVQKDSFIAALRATDGFEIWRTRRDEVPTWSTPTVHESEDGKQIIVNGWKHIGGYDLETGRELWRMRGLGDIPVPTPYVAQGLIFLTQSHGGGTPVYAVRTSASGDISLAEGETANEHVAWSDPRGGSYIPTTLVYGGLLYVLRDNGVFSVRVAATGELLYRQRIDGGHAFSASLVAGDGKIYLTSESGKVFVVKAGRTFELLATNQLDDLCLATPAISDGMIFFRTRGHLVAIADGEGPAV